MRIEVTRSARNAERNVIIDVTYISMIKYARYNWHSIIGETTLPTLHYSLFASDGCRLLYIMQFSVNIYQTPILDYTRVTLYSERIRVSCAWR